MAMMFASSENTCNWWRIAERLADYHKYLKEYVVWCLVSSGSTAVYTYVSVVAVDQVCSFTRWCLLPHDFIAGYEETNIQKERT